MRIMWDVCTFKQASYCFSHQVTVLMQIIHVSYLQKNEEVLFKEVLCCLTKHFLLFHDLLEVPLLLTAFQQKFKQ